MAVSTTLVVNFGAAAEDEALIAEVDSRSESDGGLNQSTDFIAGDTVFFLVYQTDGITELEFKPSAGNVLGAGSSQLREVTETISFADTADASLQYPPEAIQEVNWFGNDLGSIIKAGGQNIRASSSGVGVAQIIPDSYPWPLYGKLCNKRYTIRNVPNANYLTPPGNTLIRIVNLC